MLVEGVELPRRISVHGTSGSGKTTLASRIAASLGIPRVELDEIHWQAGWTPLPTEEFRRRVAALVAEEAWVVDGNYSAVRDLVWDRCDLAIILDLPRSVTTWRVLRRSCGRVLCRRVLWNENRESLRDLLSIDEERNVVLWSWRSHHRNRTDLAVEAEAAGVPLLVLRSPAAVSRFAGELGQTL